MNWYICRWHPGSRHTAISSVQTHRRGAWLPSLLLSWPTLRDDRFVAYLLCGGELRTSIICYSRCVLEFIQFQSLRRSLISLIRPQLFRSIVKHEFGVPVAAGMKWCRMMTDKCFLKCASSLDSYLSAPTKTMNRFFLWLMQRASEICALT